MLLIISSVTLSNTSLSLSFPLYSLKSNGLPYVIVVFLNNLSPPLIPIGSTFAPVLTAKNAAPSFTFSPFSRPFLVPSGNKAIASPCFNVFKVSLTAVTSLESLFTRITSNRFPKILNKGFFPSSSLAKNLTCLLAVTTISCGSTNVLWFPQYITAPSSGMFSVPTTFVL